MTMLTFCIFICTMLVASNLWLLIRVLIPLYTFSQQAHAITEGDFNALINRSRGVPEIETVRYAMECMVGHVRRAQQQSHTYAEALTSGQEAERARIARELHDDTVQSLIAIGQSVDMALNWQQNKPDQASLMLKTAHEQALTSIITLRQLIADLRPPALSELGLRAALEMQAERVTDAEVSVYVEGNPRRLDETHELVLFRSAQEAITNARRHGNATKIDLKLTFLLDSVHLNISDNGSGFQHIPEWDTLAEQGHFGLLGIRERVSSLQGEVILANGDGATLMIHLPDETSHQPAHIVRDPVCHAEIEPQQAYGSVEYAGTRYYFCCPVCQGAFQKEPEVYL